MQTFTLTPGSWTRRLAARNPLVRASDRVEALALLVALALALLAVPVAGAVGTAIYDGRVHAIATQRMNTRQVDATAVSDSEITRLPYQSSIVTELQWQVDGHNRRATVDTQTDMKAGEHTDIWVDATGAQTRPPLSGNDAVTEAATSAFLLWVVLVGALLAAWTALRRAVDRLRDATWDRELNRLVDASDR